ncbi:MAG: Holliday junction branch migration protein RuvA [Bacteroidales bacterium]|nr:Holliday junction branch migration protein RuvA [Bacteroidales bacterium]
MFAYIEGRVSEINPVCAVLDCGGVGYEIRISLHTYSQIKDLPQAKLLVHPIYREDAQQLFGFYTAVEKQLFQLLVSVSGVGANTACMILSAMSPTETVRAIMQDDVRKIQAVKGIGAKTAQRIIVDLKDKVGKVETAETPAAGGMLAQAYPQRETALGALVMLGYAKSAAEKVLDKVLAVDPAADIESVIKQALRML